MTASTHPERIGPYHILELLGDGGMGSVYLAEQKEPVRRRVALKVIRLGMASEEVLKRFDLERQALAVMNHPGIAKVFDAGTTESGQPYFVMEYVEGIPLTKYCDKHRLTVTERILLFQQVCAAVQHAHQKGVIHRDLKPDNVLVQRHGDRGMPKIIDFGLARATDQQLVAHTVFTEQGQMLGTPEYMSPEQATMDGEGIDTRTDIYSLGVMLYELLCGELPFSTAELRSAGLFEVQRKIREDEPQKPSTKIASAGLEASDSALCRRTSPVALMKNVRGDLDWIVMKAMAKEAERRYESANGLSEDLERHLEHVPVLASPPSAGYRVRKFLRRYRGQVIAAGVVLLTLLVGMASTTYFMLAEREQAELANREAAAAKAAGEAEAEQRGLAEQRAEELELVSEFQASQLSDIKPEVMGADLRRGVLVQARLAWEREDLADADMVERLGQLEDLLAGSNFTNLALDALEANIFDRALAAIDERFADQLLVTARLLDAVAVTLRQLGLLESAVVPQERSLSIRRGELGDEHHDTLTSISNMGELLLDQGKLGEAEPYYREALEGRRRMLGNEHADTLNSINNMGGLLQTQGKLGEAEPYYREALEGRRRVLGDEHADTLNSINNMGFLLHAQGKLDEAEPYYREAVEGTRHVLGEDHPSTLTSINNLGGLLENQGKLGEAEPYYREALEGHRRVLGDDHPSTLVSINNVGFLLRRQGKPDEAEPYFREALEGRRRVLGDDHPDTLASVNSMGLLLRAQGRLGETEPYYREALEGRRRMLGNDHASTLTSINNMGFLLRRQGKLDEAEPYYRELLEGRRRVLGEEHSDVARSLRALIGLLEQKGDYLAVDELTFRNDATDKAETHRQRMSAIDDGEVAAESPDELAHLAYHLYGQGRLVAAHWTFSEALNAGGYLLREKHRYNAARAAIRAGCGEGEDAVELSITDRLDISREGRKMLREELVYWNELIAEGDVQTARQRATWSTLDPDLACVRDEDAVSKLDDDEAEAWRAFWAEVKALPPPGR